MFKMVIFLVLSIPIIYISWRSIFSLKNHGLYRFISWECILWLLVSNITFWFKDWYSIPQLVSWFCLIFSIPLLIFGINKMKTIGKQDQDRDNSLYQFEKTTTLIESGIFKYIRHPLYSSLLFLTWGVFFKHIEIILFVVSMVSSIALFMTAKIEEQENIKYFGDSYRQYIQRTKMFIPFIL
jgi:protein-S-isoprenylcysteine O-methyltransferase Ste14